MYRKVTPMFLVDDLDKAMEFANSPFVILLVLSGLWLRLGIINKRSEQAFRNLFKQRISQVK